MNKDSFNYKYEDVRHEFYPIGDKLKLSEILEEATREFVPEVQFRINEQIDKASMRIAERERCHKIYLDSIKKKA